MLLTKVIHLTLTNIPRKFPPICRLCYKPGGINLISHLEIAYDITGIRGLSLLLGWGGGNLKPKPKSTSADDRFQPSGKRSSKP